MKSLSLQHPHAIIMVGIPGSGKSFFAEKFSKTFNAPYVCIDDISPLATDEKTALLLAGQQLTQLVKTHASIVVEMDTASRQNRSDLARHLKSLGYVPLFIWVQTDPETAKQRVKRSRSLDSDAFEKSLRKFSAPHESEHALVISGKHTYASQAKIVLKRLSAPRANISAHKQPATRRGQNIIIR